VQVFVADSEQEALAGAQVLRWYFDANKVPPYLANPPGYSPPKRAAAVVTSTAPVPQARQAKNQSLEWMIESGVTFAGTPDTVVKQINRFYDHVGGFGHILMMGHAGPLEYAPAARSLELYAKEVAPRLQQLGIGTGAAAR
jgi:alkanesulfonate monooxygenase SsuD/methylene tetrahydromethanopterin reductase-like flavin-dependent oxidoreductase (luciferase family)